jgi:2-succinyl-5-enolpyruvyl-6-hydroxy-3-cyclohexene-1-carboxylate synthase
MSSPRNLLTVWARLVASSLVAAGVRDVVVSPGSRSTPFLLALLDQRELRLVRAIDERGAAFIALGIGRASGRPAAVLATSGTAMAHWMPAVVEASTARIPLLLLSADRPSALAHTGAAQTIDQTRFFEPWARRSIDLGDPSADPQALVGVARSIAQAVATSAGTEPGPVHVNLRADKPLEPVEPSTDEEHALVRRADEVIARGLTAVSYGDPGADEVFARALADALVRAERPLVIAGPRSTHAADCQEALDALGLVVAPESASQLRHGHGSIAVWRFDAFELVMKTERVREQLAPDLVVQLGSLPTVDVFERLARGVPRFVIDAGGIHDPLGGARAISLGPAAATLARTAALAGPRAPDTSWAPRLRAANAIAWSAVERALAAGGGEGAIVRAAVGAAPRAPLVIGNSLPIRTLDRYVPARPEPRFVISQRGVNGIDGLVAGAAGTALALGEPTLAILGDVTFLHDASSLLAATAAVQTPLAIVVLDNGGGRIFEALPIARAGAGAMDWFTTPHDVDIAALARTLGARAHVVRSAGETARAVSQALATPGVSVVHAIVPPSDAHAAFARLASEVERDVLAMLERGAT